MDRSKRYARAAVLQAAGVEAETLKNWDRAGFIRPLSQVGDSGTGWRRFTVFEVVRIAVLARLVDCGVPVGLAHTAAQAVEVAIDDARIFDLARSTAFVATDFKRTSVAFGKNFEVGPDDPGLFILPLRPIIRDVMEKLAVCGDDDSDDPANALTLPASFEWVPKDDNEKT
jgi:hypothetical protein